MSPPPIAPDSSHTTIFQSIPVIDLSADNASVAKAIGEACSRVGFLQVINHDVTVNPTSLLDFFDIANIDAKLKLSRGNGGKYRGYFPVQDSATSYKEGFEIGGVERERSANHHQGKAVAAGKGWEILHEPNRWPEGNQFESWKVDMKLYYDQVQGLGIRILNLAGLSLGLPDGYFSPFFSHNPLSTLRLIHYPVKDEFKGTSEDVNALSCSEHTDR
jgi:isopenicillin N synthase-like dioxygenase